MTSGPSMSQMEKAWNNAWHMCSFDKMGLPKFGEETAESALEVVVSEAGVETIEDAYQPLVCTNGTIKLTFIICFLHKDYKN